MAEPAEKTGSAEVSGLSYEVLDHTADTGVSAKARSLEELVETLATGMFSLMTPVSPCPATAKVEFEVRAKTNVELVYECLSELLYLAEVEDLMFCEFVVRATEPGFLKVFAGGVPTRQTDPAGPPIKAVTYHQIEVAQTGDGWHGKVYFDV